MLVLTQAVFYTQLLAVGTRIFCTTRSWFLFLRIPNAIYYQFQQKLNSAHRVLAVLEKKSRKVRKKNSKKKLEFHWKFEIVKFDFRFGILGKFHEETYKPDFVLLQRKQIGGTKHFRLKKHAEISRKLRKIGRFRVLIMLQLSKKKSGICFVCWNLSKIPNLMKILNFSNIWVEFL